MIKNVIFEKRKLTIISNTNESNNIDLESTIQDVVFKEDRVVVLLKGLELFDTAYHNCNIVCYDEYGDLIWRIENPDKLSTSKIKTYNTFQNISLKNDKKIEAYLDSGYMVEIDIETGQFVGDWRFIK